MFRNSHVHQSLGEVWLTHVAQCEQRIEEGFVPVEATDNDLGDILVREDAWGIIAARVVKFWQAAR